MIMYLWSLIKKILNSMNENNHNNILLKIYIHEIKNMKYLSKNDLDQLQTNFTKEELIKLIHSYNEMIEYASEVIN
jgi:hypothetical protein